MTFFLCHLFEAWNELPVFFQWVFRGFLISSNKYRLNMYKGSSIYPPKKNKLCFFLQLKQQRHLQGALHLTFPPPPVLRRRYLQLFGLHVVKELQGLQGNPPPCCAYFPTFWNQRPQVSVRHKIMAFCVWIPISWNPISWNNWLIHDEGLSPKNMFSWTEANQFFDVNETNRGSSFSCGSGIPGKPRHPTLSQSQDDFQGAHNEK